MNSVSQRVDRNLKRTVAEHHSTTFYMMLWRRIFIHSTEKVDETEGSLWLPLRLENLLLLDIAFEVSVCIKSEIDRQTVFNSNCRKFILKAD